MDNFCPHSDGDPCSVCMKFMELKLAVRDMRQAQKDYFRTRSGLDRAKQTEQFVDRLLRGYQLTQQELF